MSISNDVHDNLRTIRDQASIHSGEKNKLVLHSDNENLKNILALYQFNFDIYCGVKFKICSAYLLDYTMVDPKSAYVIEMRLLRTHSVIRLALSVAARFGYQTDRDIKHFHDDNYSRYSSI